MLEKVLISSEYGVLLSPGCERYNSYKGYGTSFTWSGNYTPSEEERKLDKSGRLASTVVAIDATYFGDSAKQYTKEAINRELNKVTIIYTNIYNCRVCLLNAQIFGTTSLI